MMNSTTYHPENSTASILPGARWQSVYQTLDSFGVAVPGGRAGPVGVGGLTIGGGNSFFAARYSFVCDDVVNFEVVLANGSIINANNHTNSDLFKALKGGSNNFGIVTKIDLYAFPQGDRGVVSYDNSTSTTAQLIPAIVNFTNHVEDDPYVSLITFWQYSSTSGANVIVNALEYTKPVANPPVFSQIVSIVNTSSTMRIASLYELTSELAQVSGFRELFLTLTFVNDARVIEKAVGLHNSLIEEAKASVRSIEWTFETIFQPLPALFSRRSVARGEMFLAWTVFLFDLSWQDAADDALFHRIGDTMVSQLTSYARTIHADNEFIYLNYADRSQNPLRSYGAANLAYIRQVAEKYDPAGVFQTLVPGGFKVTAA
ncbi:hypothetical protein VTN77DRAFT_5979 [Rasamsonia byssochlamydoides]|uniref:uncharacterized protein n=1 Tax=Rasamsonia byssochlamydoides TaxID=89139 RepID=UPI0037421A4C